MEFCYSTAVCMVAASRHSLVDKHVVVVAALLAHLGYRFNLNFNNHFHLHFPFTNLADVVIVAEQPLLVRADVRRIMA